MSTAILILGLLKLEGFRKLDFDTWRSLKAQLLAGIITENQSF